MKRRFDQIDRSAKVLYPEQAYAFEKLDNDLFSVSLAVINPIPLLPYPGKINSVEGWLENIDEISRIGEAEPDLWQMRGNAFRNNFSKGMRKRYNDLYHDDDLKIIKSPEYITYNTVVDFHFDRALNDSVFDFSVDLNPEIEMASATFKNYSPQLFSLDKNFRAAQEFELSGRNYYDFNKKYTLMSKRLEEKGIADTTGQFVVWGASIAIKKAAALYGDNAINFIMSRDYTGSIDTRKYILVKEQRDQYNNPSSAPITVPLTGTEDLFNICETILAAQNNKQDLLNPKQTNLLVSGLQKRSEAGDPAKEEIISTKEEIIAKASQPTMSFGQILQLALKEKLALAG